MGVQERAQHTALRGSSIQCDRKAHVGAMGTVRQKVQVQMGERRPRWNSLLMSGVIVLKAVLESIKGILT